MQVLHPYIIVDRKISKGSPIIVGTRTRVLDITIEYEYLGSTPDEIVDAHPHLLKFMMPYRSTMNTVRNWTWKSGKERKRLRKFVKI
jgi:uncharacterized protein (DUF433 family)